MPRISPKAGTGGHRRFLIHYDAIFGLGTIFEQLDQPDQAYDAYQLVLELHPHHEEARSRLKRLERDVNGAEL